MDLSEKLTENFSFWEVADHHYNPRRPPEGAELANMQRLLARVVQPMRSQWGRRLWVVSGYRTPETNAKVGGAHLSQHMLGTAVDLAPFEFSVVAQLRAGLDIGPDNEKLLREWLDFTAWWVRHDPCDYVGGYGQYPRSGWVHLDIRHRGPGNHLYTWQGNGVGSEG